MARGGSVRVKFDADTSDLQRGTRTAERDLERLNRAGTRSLGGLKTAALAGGAALGGGLVVGMAAATRAAVEAEKSSAKLNAQLKAIGKNSAATRKEIDAVVTAQSKMSGFDDEDLTDSFTNIVRATGDVKRSLELNNLAMDIARAKNMDIAKAGELVGKVANGNVGILKRYGVTVKEGATVQEALAGAQRQFAGQAEAYGKTTAGAQDRARVAFENLGETVGQKIAPMIANALNSLAGTLNKLIAAWPRLQATVMGVVNRVRDAISSFVERNRADINSFISAVRNVGAAVRAVFEGVVLPVIRRLLPAIRQVFQGAITTIRGAVRVITGVLTGDFGRAWDGVKDIFRGAVKALGGIIRGATAPLRAAGKALVDAIVAGIKAAPGAIVDALKSLIPGPLRGKLNIPGIGNINPLARKQAGGIIPGSGRGDIVPALLEPGEFVVRRKVVEKFGPTYFAALNAQRMANGGLVHRAAAAAGFRGNALRIAQAVAQAESGGNPRAIGDRTLGGSHGLWQVHLPSHPNYDPQKLFDPFYNARAAYAISGGGRNWNPWTTFRTGAYRRFLAQAISGGTTGGGTSRATKTPAKKPRGLGISKGAGAGNVPGMGAVVGGEFQPVDVGYEVGASSVSEPVTGERSSNAMPSGTVFTSMSEYVRAWMKPIDQKERAGRITPAQAYAERRAILVHALNGGYGPLSESDRLDLEGDLRELDQQAAAAAAAAAAPDLQAQLDQANLKAFNANRAFQLSEAGFGVIRQSGDIGYGIQGGAPVTIINTLHPSDPRTLDAIASANARAWDSQGGRTSTAHVSGV